MGDLPATPAKKPMIENNTPDKTWLNVTRERIRKDIEGYKPETIAGCNPDKRFIVRENFENVKAAIMDMTEKFNHKQDSIVPPKAYYDVMKSMIVGVSLKRSTGNTSKTNDLQDKYPTLNITINNK